MKKTEHGITFDKLCQIEDEVSEYLWKPDDIFYCIDDIDRKSVV